MRVEIAELSGTDILRGRPLGRRHFAKLCDTLATAPKGQVVFLDFSGVKAVNGSWINSAVSELFRWTRHDDIDLYPVLHRVPERDIDELELVAAINKASYPCSNSLKLPLHQVELVGPLDNALARTLEIVAKAIEITGAELDQRDGIGATGWNNRLKDLFDLRLLNRRKVGRRQIYGPLAKEMIPYGR